AGRRLLFAGDIEAAGEERLRDARLRADVLKVPHHGSRSSSGPDFVAAVRPAIAVISLGAHNKWGFPNTGVLQRYQEVGSEIYRTDRDGAVEVRITSDGHITAQKER